MPSPGGTANPRLPIEDSYLQLLADTLDGLDLPARGQFLQRYFRTITHLDLREDQCIQLWDEMITRQRELSENLSRSVGLKTALMDVLTSAGLFRVPIILEYDELKALQLNAVTDPLTGLYNRRLFGEVFDKELNRSRRYGSHLGLVILDLHRFKEVNDKHGHPRGDDVLRAAAATLKKALRTSDSAFRIGGDEFALLLPETDPEQANTLCRRIRAQFENDIREMNLDIGVTLDFGIAVHPQDGDSKRTLLGLADKRLYELKNIGRDAGPMPFSRRGRPLETFPPREEKEKPREPATPEAAPQDAGRQEPASRATPPREIPSVPHTPFVRPSPPTGFPGAPQPSRPAPPVEHRKFERVSLAGTKAYAVLAEATQRHAAVVDLSYGGVALLVEKPEELPAQFNAILHVPILPPVRVVLHKAYTQRAEGGRSRVGCSFVS